VSQSWDLENKSKTTSLEDIKSAERDELKVGREEVARGR